MNFSLAWLRGPAAEDALPDLLCGLIRDIRLILVHPDLGNASKLTAITETVDRLAPPPGPEASHTQAVASVVALLARNTGPATLLFEQLAGEQIRVELTGRTDRLLTVAECGELRVPAGTRGHQRTGMLCTEESGLVAAGVTSIVIPARLPGHALRELGIPGPDDPAPPLSGIPLGKALAGLGVHREPLGARLVRDSPGGRVSLESSARMWLGGVPVALASERVTAELCRRAAARLPGVGGASASRQPGGLATPEPAPYAVSAVSDCL